MTRTKDRFMRILFLAVVLVLAFGASARSFAAPPEDALSRARQLAFSGKEHRAEALQILKQHLAEDPTDTDARVFYGIVLSWEGQYDQARAQLQPVVEKNPDHSDALPALIDVELWSDHPKRAAELAQASLQRHPKNPTMLLLYARALRNERKSRDAVRVLDELLTVQPNNRQAQEMRHSMEVDSWGWQINAEYLYDWYGAGRGSQHESSLALRIPTGAGSLYFRESRADRFSEDSYLSEIEFYPSIRPGTYGYLEFGGSVDSRLYPQYRLGAELFQSLGHGWEASGGYRRLQFGTGTNIATWSVSKYYGNYLFTGRMYITPDDLGVSTTGVFLARRFFGKEGLHDYLEVRFSRGASIAQARTTLETISLNSTRVTVTFDKTFGHWAVAFTGGAGTEELVGGTNMNRFTGGATVYYRF